MALTKAEIQEYLYELSSKKGFITEQEIEKCCDENDVDLFDIDKILQYLIDKKVLIQNTPSTNDEEEDSYDKAHVDFESFYNEVLEKFPEQIYFINDLRRIQPPQKNEWQLLIPKAKEGNEFARQRVISMYLRSVFRQAYIFASSYGCDINTCLENGVLGLYDAIDAYDITSPTAFPGYYGYYVLRTMQRSYRKLNSVVDIKTHELGSLISFLSDYKNIISKYGIDELYDFIPEDELQYFRQSHKSLFEYLLPTHLYNLNLMVYNAKIDELCVYNDLHNKIFKALNNLKPKEKDVIIRRFGFLDGNDYTLEEVGKVHNVTRERIRQIEAKALRVLRRTSNLQYFEGFYDKQIEKQEDIDFELCYLVKLIDFFPEIICYNKTEYEKDGFIIEINEFSEE